MNTVMESVYEAKDIACYGIFVATALSIFFYFLNIFDVFRLTDNDSFTS